MATMPAFKLKSTVDRNNVSSVTEVVNKYAFEFYVYIELEPDVYKFDFALFEIEEIGEHENFLCPIQNVERLSRVWLRISSNSLNLHPGHHTYRMHMVDTHTDNVISVYFSYLLQDDHPDRPYIYMDPDKRGACCCNVTSNNRVS